MVLSAVMRTAQSVAMDGHVPLPPPVPWIEAVAGVRSLKHPYAPPLLALPRKPPDPVPDGEGRRAATVAPKLVN
jgi:hypothetical protein